MFYIGKGSRNKRKGYGRAHARDNRNRIWQRLVAKLQGEFLVTVLAEFWHESDAFQYEAELIRQHGRHDKGGTLCNLTDGGEGGIGRVVSQESIERRRKTMEGRPHLHAGKGPMLGRTHSCESRRAISDAASGANNSMFGRKHTTESIQRMKYRNRGSEKKAKAVVDTSTGKAYGSIREAALALGYNPATLKHWLSGRYTNRSPVRLA